MLSPVQEQNWELDFSRFGGLIFGVPSDVTSRVDCSRVGPLAASSPAL